MTIDGPRIAITSTFLAVAGISSYFVYTGWSHTPRSDSDLTWAVLLINTLFASLASITQLLYLFKKRLKWCGTALDCVLTVTCIKPLIEWLYYVSMICYTAICMGVSYLYLSHDVDVPHDPQVRDAFQVQIIGLGALAVIVLATLCSQMCGCCKKNRGPKRLPGESDRAYLTRYADYRSDSD